MATEKVDFTLKVKANAKTIISAALEAQELGDIWDDRGYASGGSDPITSGDLTGIEATPTQLASFRTFVTNFIKFMDADSPTNNDYRDTLNDIRDI